MYSQGRAYYLIYLVAILVFGFAEVSSAAEPVLVRVDGIEGAAKKNIEAALVLPDGLIQDGTVDKLWLERFSAQAEAKTVEALEPFGYYSPQVSASLEGNGETGYILLVKVTPGELVRLTEVEVKLEGPGAVDELLLKHVASFPLRNGEPLLHEPYEKAKSDLLAAAREQGYLDADFPVHEIQVDPTATSAQVRLVMASGPRFMFGTVTIEGATYLPEELLRRYISFSPKEVFSYTALAKTQRNFAVSPYFKSVSVIPEKEKSRDNQVPVVVRVTPAARQTIRPGFGYGTDTGLRGSVGYKDLSLFSPGHILNTELTIAERLQGAAIAYSIPSYQNLDTVTTVQFNLQREDVNATISKLAALELSRTTGFGGNRLGTVYIRAQYEEFTAGLENSTARLLLPGVRFLQNSYDTMIRPTQGYHYQLETRGTHQLLGSDASFVQLIVEGGGIVSLPGRLTLKAKTKAGFTMLDDPFSVLPTSLRFFAGGDNSVRGYSYKSLGPKDAVGKVVGGRNLLQGSVELERALFDKWGASIFYDSGNAYDSLTDFRLYQGAGIGLHYYTPIGSVNLSLARQLGLTDPKFKVHFTIGFQL